MESSRRCSSARPSSSTRSRTSWSPCRSACKLEGEEQKKQRQMDLERLLQRYQNVKSELEAQQNLERIRAERMASSGQWNWGSTTTKAGAQVA